MEEDRLIQERKEKLVKFFKTKYDWIAYAILAIIVYIAVYIRTLNLPTLRDITTGGWTLGPDLDPFLFLRWTKYIIEHGSLMAIDTMRYVPLGFDTSREMILLPYSMAWFHKLAVFFGSTSVEQSAVIYPVFMFALTVIAFFFLVRKIFIEDFGKIKANAIALISCFFLTVLPALLPRTIAGIPEKESAAFLFMFLAFYFFISAWKSKTNFSRYSLVVLSGLATTAMSLIWGGSAYIYIVIAGAVFIGFFLGQINNARFYIYSVWLFISWLLPSLFTSRFSLINLLTSTISGLSIGIFIIIGFNLFLFKYFEKYLNGKTISKIPKPVKSTILSIILAGLIGIIFFGFDFISHKFSDIIGNMITPITTRFGVTVAENRQPFFQEWASNFGPVVNGIPLFFWLFFVGSISLFYFMIRKIFTKKENIILTISYTAFLFALIFSRYSSTKLLNGTNGTSLFVYASGFIILIASFGYYYYAYFRENKEEKLKDINFGIILLFFLFFFSIISARGSVRTIMVLVPPSAAIVAYFVISVFDYARKSKESSKIYAWIIFGIIFMITLLSAYNPSEKVDSLYETSASQAINYGPTVYTQQWQKAMEWVRDNTPENAVFGHWWDYGYWLQSIGNRATVLDGGNAFGYWNYLMGRYALTGTNNQEALEVLYSHNATHFLIDSSDLGKYSAFSSIGSDANYDRYSWIPILLRNPSQSQETKNSVLNVYNGGFYLESDIVYDSNGTKVFLPANKAAIAGIIVETDLSGNILSQPQGVFFYQNKEYRLPLRYAYDTKFTDFGIG
ncbi:MAG: STT3 domain-containing protein, partial [archaeon]|nr:STT3 domain-containing protein [archaeon]